MRSLWTNRRYVTWLVSDTSKGLAGTLFSFAIPLIALIVTNDPAQAGVIGGVGMAVRLIAMIYGGVLADRHDRIALMLLGAAVGTVLATGFLVLALSDALTFTTLLVAQVLLVARAGLFDPAGESALKEIVPSEAMGRAQAANQGRDAVLQLAGGPLGGALLAGGAWFIGAAMTIGYGFAALTAWRLRAAPAGQRAFDPQESVAPARDTLREVREGFSFLLSRPDLSGVLWITTIVNLGFNAALTTVIFSLQQSGHAELTIGWLSAVLGGTMLVGAIMAPRLVARVGAGILTIVGLGIAAVGVIALNAVHEPWVIAIVLAASVLLLPALNSSMLGYFMVATPTRLLGRANSALGVLSMGAMPLAPLIAGFGLAWFGRGPTLLLTAALCLVSAVLAAGNRTLRELPAEPGWAAHADRFERAGSASGH